MNEDSMVMFAEMLRHHITYLILYGEGIVEKRREEKGRAERGCNSCTWRRSIYESTAAAAGWIRVNSYIVVLLR